MPCYTLPCKIFTSENKRQSEISDEPQGTVAATHWRCDGTGNVNDLFYYKFTGADPIAAAIKRLLKVGSD